MEEVRGRRAEGRPVAAGGISRVLFYLVQFTWGLPVNLFGGAMYLLLRGRFRHERFRNAFITYIPGNWGGVSLGLFIFIAEGKDEGWTRDTRIHEYGHTIQCLLLGPFYWFVIGIPSAVWCNFFGAYRRKRNISYYKLYCESWANKWGSKWSGMKQYGVK